MMDDSRIRCTTSVAVRPCPAPARASPGRELTAEGLNRIQSIAFLVAGCLAVIFCLCFALLGFAADSAAGIPELEHRINPNDAPPASLVRLPGIGLSGAQAIVTYRQQFRQQGRGDLAFRDCNDLRNIKGIGPAIVREMCEWLRFQ